MKHLIGHTSPETAFVVDDYPYGFLLRCKIRYWLEYKKGYGYRLGSQTTNPKVAGEHWNKPKYSIYTELAVMVRVPSNDKGIEAVSWVGLSLYHIPEELERFVYTHEEALKGELEQSIIAGYRAALLRRAQRLDALHPVIHQD